MSADYAPFPRAELEAFAQFSPIKGVSRACREALLHHEANEQEILRLRLENGQLRRQLDCALHPLVSLETVIIE